MKFRHGRCQNEEPPTKTADKGRTKQRAEKKRGEKNKPPTTRGKAKEKVDQAKSGTATHTPTRLVFPEVMPREAPQGRRLLIRFCAPELCLSFEKVLKG